MIHKFTLIIGIGLLSGLPACGSGDDNGQPKKPTTMLITEMVVRGDSGDWLEITNVSDRAQPLAGLTITVDGNTHTLATDGSLEPGAALVLGTSEALLDLSPSVASIVWDNFSLDDEAGTISLANNNPMDSNTTEIDTVSYSASSNWPLHRNSTLQLHPIPDDNDANRNDDPLEWCTSGLGIPPTPAEKNAPCPLWDKNSPIRDNQKLYELDGLDPVIMNVTMDSSELALLNEVVDDTPVGPFPSTLDVEDDTYSGTIEVRGATSRLSSQKSFKIRLTSGAYGHQETLNLNKHPYDFSRMRNHVAFTMLRDLPDLISMRTKFVHLFVNGADYGLFTQVEQLNRRGLRHHGLDARGTLFKPDLFDFDDVSETDRETGVISGLDLKTGPGYQGIITAVDAIYDDTMSADEVIEAHFNRDNLLTFLAMAFILENIDTRSQNFYLYASPREPERFYLLPWDLDGSMGWYDAHGSELAQFTQGLSNWWEVGLWQRALTSPTFVAELSDKIDTLRDVFGARDLTTIVANMDIIVSEFLSRPPDSDSTTLQAHDRNRNLTLLRETVERRWQVFQDTIELPMPFYTLIEANMDGSFSFYWDPVFDLQGDATTMDILFSNQPCLDVDIDCFADENIVARLTGLTDTSTTQTAAEIGLAPGNYFVQFRAYDSKNNSQTEYNEFEPTEISIP